MKEIRGRKGESSGTMETRRGEAGGTRETRRRAENDIYKRRATDTE